MSILSDSGERTGVAFEPVPTVPAIDSPATPPGWVLARRVAQVASPIFVALAAYLLRRLS
jgi:hypothetical protein